MHSSPSDSLTPFCFSANVKFVVTDIKRDPNLLVCGLFLEEKAFVELMPIDTSHRPREMARAFLTTPCGHQEVHHCS